MTLLDRSKNLRDLNRFREEMVPWSSPCNVRLSLSLAARVEHVPGTLRCRLPLEFQTPDILPLSLHLESG